LGAKTLQQWGMPLVRVGCNAQLVFPKKMYTLALQTVIPMNGDSEKLMGFFCKYSRLQIQMLVLELRGNLLNTG